MKTANKITRAIFLLITFLFFLAVQCEYEEGEHDSSFGIGTYHGELTVCPDGATVEGMDVSYWQGTIDWDAVASSGIEFAFIRVSDGHFEDPQFERNWSEARRVGIIRGVYQFFRASQDPVSQAELLLRKMGPLEPGDLPPVADVEVTDGEPASVIIDHLHQWMNTIESAIGRKPIIYTAKYFWQDNVGTDEFSHYPLWVAHWEVSCPNLPNQWSEWVFWQTTSSGSVAGVGSSRVDLDVFNGDLNGLLEFATATPECGDGICNGDETHESCPEDCPICETIPPEGRIVDESEVCFEKAGPSQYWHPEEAGWNNSLIWTHTTDEDVIYNYGIWHFEFDEAGIYLLEAYTASPWAESRQAGYIIHHNGVEDVVVVDQTGADGWNYIGQFEFAEGADQWVRLNDNTGEPNSTNTQLVFDAIRVTRVNFQEEEQAEGEEVVEPTPELEPYPEQMAVEEETFPEEEPTQELQPEQTRGEEGDQFGVYGAGLESGCSCNLI